MKRSRVPFLLLVVLVSSGCLRYTPSRAELVDSGAGEESKTTLAGPEAIQEAEKVRRVELNRLVSNRKHAVLNSVGKTYHIGSGDMLDISVFDLPELNTKARVRPDGTISLSLLNSVTVAGETETSVQQKIQRSLAPYVINPKVKVFIAEYDARKVSVIGAVEKPGTFPLKEDHTTVLDMISRAGGRNELAGSRIILLPAEIQGPGVSIGGQSPAREGVIDEGVEFYIDDLTGANGEVPQLIPLVNGDTIVIPEAGQVQVAGDVKKPGSYRLTAKMSILGAVAAAGGLQYSANANEIEVIRDIAPGKKAAMVLDLERIALNNSADFRLRDGDVVRVPSSPGRFAGQQTVEFINGIFNVGMSAGP